MRTVAWTRPLALVWTAVIASLGCGGDTVTNPIPESELFWKISMSHRAVTLSTRAPYDTVQLVMTPLSFQGVPITTPATVQYRSADTSILVSPSGLLTGHSRRIGAWVYVTMTVNKVTIRDSIRVSVTGTVPTLATFSMQPLAGDSAIGGCGSTAKFGGTRVARVRDITNRSMDSVAVVYWSADRTIATIQPLTGVVTASCVTQQKSVKLYASATVYGTPVIDSVEYIVIPPILAYVGASTGRKTASGDSVVNYGPGTITVSVGAVVIWQWLFPNDLVFDDPAVALAVDTTVAGVTPDGTGGNLPVFGEPCSTLLCIATGGIERSSRARRFITPGTYHYRSSIYQSMGGTIVVRARTP